MPRHPGGLGPAVAEELFGAPKAWFVACRAMFRDVDGPLLVSTHVGRHVLEPRGGRPQGNRA